MAQLLTEFEALTEGACMLCICSCSIQGKPQFRIKHLATLLCL